MKHTKFPKGWDEEKIQRVIRYYEGQSDVEAIEEYKKEASFRISKSANLRKSHRREPLSFRKFPKGDKPKTRHR